MFSVDRDENTNKELFVRANEFLIYIPEKGEVASLGTVDPVETVRIQPNHWTIPQRPIEIHIAGGVADGIEAGPAAEGGGVVAVAEVVQAARDIEPAALMQVEPTEGAGGERVPAGVEDRYLAERVVDVAFDDVARIVKERGDIIVGVLGDVQPFVQRAIGAIARLVGLSRKSVYKALEPARGVA